MAREEREWHPKFIEYMDFIIQHPNYKGLPITKKSDGSWSWFGTKKTQIGKARIAWCENKAKELGFQLSQAFMRMLCVRFILPNGKYVKPVAIQCQFIITIKC